MKQFNLRELTITNLLLVRVVADLRSMWYTHPSNKDKPPLFT